MKEKANSNINQKKQLLALNEQLYQSELKTNQNSSSKTVKSFFTLLPIILNICLSQFYFGYGVAYFSSINLSTLVSYYSISLSSDVANGLLNGCISIGAGIGSVLSSVFIIKFSRKNCVLVINCIAITAGILIFIPNQICLIFMRLVQGFCIGLYSATIPMYVKQLSPIQYSGSFGAFNQFFIAFGVFFSFLFTFILQTIFHDESDQKTWFYVFGFPLVILVIQSILLLTKFSYQTPKYLILQNKDQNQVKQLLSVLYQKDFLNQIYEKFVEIQYPEQSIEKIIKQKNQRVQEINEQKLRKSPKIAIFVALFMSFSQQMVGMNAVIIYGGQITTEVIPSLKSIFPLIINLPPIFSALIISYFLSKYGRKKILMIGILCLGIINLILGVGFFVKDSYLNLSIALILISQFSYSSVFGASVGPILWVYMPEIVQNYVLPYSTLMNWIGSAIVLILFPIIKDALPNHNPGGLFIWFSLYTFICLIVYSKLVIETKDKNQKQISEEYKNKKWKLF